MTQVVLTLISPNRRHVLENLFPYYIYDMAQFTKWSPNEEGLYHYDYGKFDLYWQRKDYFPYFVMSGGSLAGFALVRRYPSRPNVWDIEQFFILNRFNGQGLGTQVLSQLVKKHTGRWQIRALLNNHAALAFWPKAISNLVGEKFRRSVQCDVDLDMQFFEFEYSLENKS